MLSYEVFAAAGCLAGLVYVRAVGLARARTRWAVDFVAISATTLLCRVLLPIDIATPSRTQSAAGMLDHAAQIAAVGVRVAGAAIVPIRVVSPWVGVGLLAVGLTSGAGLRRRLRRDASARLELGRWLALAAAGCALAAAAWAVYVPAPAHYSPSAAGTVNRVNALAGIGIALLVFSVLMLVGAPLPTRARGTRPRRISGRSCRTCARPYRDRPAARSSMRSTPRGWWRPVCPCWAPRST